MFGKGKMGEFQFPKGKIILAFHTNFLFAFGVVFPLFLCSELSETVKAIERKQLFYFRRGHSSM